MTQKEIKFTIEQDEEKIPEKIYWEATDNPNEGLEETKAIAVGVWDHFHRGTLFIPLWSKDMEVLDMKRFCIEMLGCVADTLRNATGDEIMAAEIDEVGMALSKRLQKEMQAVQQGQ
ncbi:gliding motility protein GldC [Runella sp. CRIBMP]|uniref:gliding motility protein GldC n=1 Tax=Runella sp. CRIBMP TaxID=2683261 RepID=UPI0014135B8B|nr:gliding motility protein GldC [Runella sp. CRIBMP]NBB18724.1 gliding motility protein GldC [Runella sp. CRIBMP]